ncbi:hypothetical protein QUA70_12475 [Microcoleus sp. LAD1_D5]|uniref:hypothetical protein n=1 Tax=unclassified Microcoleus TaxID=2642155 RepID=UPI002FD310BF
MNFKRRIDWRKWLGVAGWVALGYFMGRPDQLERLARNLNNQMATQRLIIPATVTTIHQPVLIQRQPIIVAAPQPLPQVLTQGWSQLSDPQARFSILVPGAVEKQENSQEQTFSVTTTNEFYSIRHSNFLNSELITDKGKQAVLENAAETFNPQDFRVVSKRSFGLNGVPGVEIHLQHRDANMPPTVMRQMVVDDRFYSVWVTTPYPQNAQAFLNSFRLH